MTPPRMPNNTWAAADQLAPWRGLVWTPTFSRFVRSYCSVSGYLVERGPTNAVFLARPRRDDEAGSFTAHVLALSVTTMGRERLRFEPCGSFTVRRMGQMDIDLLGGFASVIAQRLEVVEALPEFERSAGRQAFAAKLKAAELEFARLR